MAMPSSEFGLAMSDGPSRATSAAPTPRRFHGPSSSSARPRGPPSESVGGAMSDDEGEGFADDKVPQRIRRTNGEPIPRVEDKIGLAVQQYFESFIEECVPSAPFSLLRPL